MNAPSDLRADQSQADLERFRDLESHVMNVRVWASLLEMAVDEMDAIGGQTRDEKNIAAGRIYCATYGLKRAADDLHATYYGRPKEEAA